MAHFVEELQQEAGAAIEAMRAAALRARTLHARAELMRHMLATARKVMRLPREKAVDTVVGEWMKAWALGEDAYPGIAAEMRAFTSAFCAFAAAQTTQADQELRRRAEALDAAFARIGTSLADQMAWRSECAHGWWELVAPAPADLPAGSERPGVPRPEPGRPFWECGCAPRCRDGSQ